MSKVAAIISILLASCLLLIATADARDSRESLERAAATAEVFIYGEQSKNEALLREISDPDQYEAMEEIRAKEKGKPNENVHVEDVEITEIDGDRAIAKATYRQKHKKGKTQEDVYLQRVDGKWQVTTPPNSESE